ncbi:hypothetical protein [Streptomyces sp. NPDC050145]|uniref:hypothetical protein n=1 Tax=Streptomyces sp. NPDC050145 TaxID=3365602 RepID=UPI003790563A
MEKTIMAQAEQETGVPVADAEREQARYALEELAATECGRVSGARVPESVLEPVRPFFELGWALGVRLGYTGRALSGVPVDADTVRRAFAQLRNAWLDQGEVEPVLWQRVRYHGSVERKHGLWWVYGVRQVCHRADEPAEVRYDLCEVYGNTIVTQVTNVRRESVTPLPEYRARG